jgi:hypothetical protein
MGGDRWGVCGTSKVRTCNVLEGVRKEARGERENDRTWYRRIRRVNTWPLEDSE